MVEKKSEHQKLQESIVAKPQHASKILKKKETYTFSAEYKKFVSVNKTEREVIETFVKAAKKAGFTDLKAANTIKLGGLYYLENGTKNLALVRYGGLEELRVIAGHVDSPCLHLKPYPVQESQKLAILRTHYYGGVKKYQWTNVPLALHGVAFTQKGKKVTICYGEDENEPTLIIPDLLPHLARDQLDKKAREAVTGEQLNALIGNVPVDDDKIKNPVKLAVLKYLHDKYGLIENDLIGAELLLVPAGKARDVGIDASMMAAYGHDDRCCSYAGFRAVLDNKNVKHTQVAVFYDKEEIGSEGRTGAQNVFFTTLIEELIARSKSPLRPLQVWERTKVISADVTAPIDPTHTEVSDVTNSTYLGHGVAIEKYGGGGGGKYSTNDADAEFTSAVTRMFTKHKVPWQAGELGKLDIGGGGTIAKFLAAQGAHVIDVGAPVLAMHAPFEVLSKYDLYSMYKAYSVFLREEL